MLINGCPYLILNVIYWLHENVKMTGTIFCVYTNFVLIRIKIFTFILGKITAHVKKYLEDSRAVFARKCMYMYLSLLPGAFWIFYQENELHKGNTGK